MDLMTAFVAVHAEELRAEAARARRVRAARVHHPRRSLVDAITAAVGHRRHTVAPTAPCCA